MAASIRTALCDVSGIEVPVVRAGMSVYTSADLVVAVSEAGALGSLGAWQRPAADLEAAIEQIRSRTDRPFAVNHLPPDLDDDAFDLTIRARPPVISFATGDPGDLVARAHDVGSLVTNQVTLADQAEQSAELGVDVVIAQGGEAGGYGGSVATTVLVPDVVRRVHPVPVVAAGGLVDGAGLVAALALGAAGISLGTRFLASVEAPIGRRYQELIVGSSVADARKVPNMNRLIPRPGANGYGTELRMLPTPFVERLEQADTAEEFDRLRDELISAALGGDKDELIAAAGQSSGLLDAVEPAADIVHRIVDEARDVLGGLPDARG
jgi:nitronate monooxygenase/enoyl-[acyl-carrier protein] reductase II